MSTLAVTKRLSVMIPFTLYFDPNAFVPLACLILSTIPLAVCPPVSQNGQPVQDSADTWAGVIANVAPLMALVGERNAKEHMRTASSWHQFLLLATAPLGILSIMVSALRLTGSGFLRRLVGRNSERRSEALVELTPLSVAPASSVYTSRAIEIEPFQAKDRLAFVCGHIKAFPDANKAVDGFKELIDHGDGKIEEDKDREVVLTVWHSSLSLEQAAELAISFTQDGRQEPSTFFDALALASLSYRITGVSPTQIASDAKSRTRLLSQWKDILVATGFVALLVGMQVLNFRMTHSPSTFWMGVFGYLGVVTFTFGLLLMIKGEVVAEPEFLPSLFKDAYWTFSDSRHAEHRPTKGPSSNALITARPAQHSPEVRRRRNYLTSLSTVGLIGSYVVWYLSLRVAPWWVALSNLGIIWLAAAYRAVVSQNFLTATKEDVGDDEHWIGLFRNTVSESLLATVGGAERRVWQHVHEPGPLTPSSVTTTEAEDLIIVERQAQKAASPPRQTILFIVPSIRTGLRTWSGTEDVMKVGLELAKQSCKLRTLKLDSQALPGSHYWLRLVRFKMAIYVPGLVWKATQSVDFALPSEFDLESLVRHVMKLLHVCMDHEGMVTYHSVDREKSVELSHVLCGPIADPPVNVDFGKATTTTLRSVLTALRDNEENSQTSKFSLEQAVLLPTVTVACIYDRWMHGIGYDEIERVQKRHIDGLGLSGQAFLGTMEKEFDRLKLWDDFMVEKGPADGEGDQETLLPRGASSGEYNLHNVRDRHMDYTRQAAEVTTIQDGDFVSRE